MATIIGTIHHIGSFEKVNEKFEKKEIILKTEEQPQYPQYIKMEFHNSQISNLDPFKTSDKVSVEFNLRGRLKKDDPTQCFNSLQGWKIQKT